MPYIMPPIPQFPGTASVPVPPLWQPGAPAPVVGAQPRAQPAAPAGVAPYDPNTPSAPQPSKIPGGLAALRDPRVIGMLLSVAQGLAQPRAPGATGVTNAANAMMGGYNTLMNARLLQEERDRVYREELRREQELQLKKPQVGAVVEATRAGTEETRTRTGEIPKASARADKLVTAQISQGETQLSQGQQRIDLAAEAQKADASYQAAMLVATKDMNVERSRQFNEELKAKKSQFDQELTLAKERQKANVKDSAADQRLRAAAIAVSRTSAEASMLGAQAAMERARAENRPLTTAEYTRHLSSLTNSFLRSMLPEEGVTPEMQAAKAKQFAEAILGPSPGVAGGKTQQQQKDSRGRPIFTNPQTGEQAVLDESGQWVPPER